MENVSIGTGSAAYMSRADYRAIINKFLTLCFAHLSINLRSRFIMSTTRGWYFFLREKNLYTLILNKIEGMRKFEWEKNICSRLQVLWCHNF